MAEKIPLIVLRLEGAWQAWGDHSKWDARDSGDFPTKSGVVGLLACAMGMERGDRELVSLSHAIRMAVRGDRPGTRVVDFQTVQGRPHLYTAENGHRAEDKSNIVSRRWYLEDASFLVLMETDEGWRQRIVSALKAPKWTVYLGRKSCVPSRPVFECVTKDYDGLVDGLVRYPLAARAEAGCLRYESEVALPGASRVTRADALVRAERGFAQRTVYTGVVKREVPHVSDEN